MESSKRRGEAARVPKGTLTAFQSSPRMLKKLAFASLPLFFTPSPSLSSSSGQIKSVLCCLVSLSLPCLERCIWISSLPPAAPYIRYDTWTELCLGALLVHALTLLTLCRYHLRGVQPASVVPHHLHLLPAAKKAKRNMAFFPRAYCTNPGSITTASGPLLEPDGLSSSQDSLPHSCSFPIATLSGCFWGLRMCLVTRSSVSCVCFSLGRIRMGAANGTAGWRDGRQ
ncbi:hypothetical protein V8C34DRAFT_157416 [Trichoderma compactum]